MSGLRKVRIRYRRSRVTVKCHKPELCAACQAQGRLEFHHYHYAFKTKDVRKKPYLALMHGLWLCYQCHKIADMLRNMAWAENRVNVVHEALIKQIIKDRGMLGRQPSDREGPRGGKEDHAT